VVAYGSCSLSGAEKNWSATEKECFAVVHFMNHCRHFLLGAKFEVLSDHQALPWMFGQAEPPTGKLAWQGGYSKSSHFNIKPVKRISNIEELREDPAFEWILKALNGDEPGCQWKTTRQLALLDHMVIDEDGELYHTYWPQSKTATKGILLQ